METCPICYYQYYRAIRDCPICTYSTLELIENYLNEIYLDRAEQP